MMQHLYYLFGHVSFLLGPLQNYQFLCQARQSRCWWASFSLRSPSALWRLLPKSLYFPWFLSENHNVGLCYTHFVVVFSQKVIILQPGLLKWVPLRRRISIDVDPCGSFCDTFKHFAVGVLFWNICAWIALIAVSKDITWFLTPTLLKMNGHRAVICVTNNSQWNTYWSSVTISLRPEIDFIELAACEIYLRTLILVSF